MTGLACADVIDPHCDFLQQTLQQVNDIRAD
jgi:hypothetical protein